MSARALRAAVGGHGKLVDETAATVKREGYIDVRSEGGANKHYSLRPYREPREAEEVEDAVDL